MGSLLDTGSEGFSWGAPAVPPPERPYKDAMVGRWLIPAGAVVALLPQVSSAAALLLGAAIALLVGNPWAAWTRRVQKLLLPAAVVGLGAAMDLGVVLRTGLQGFGYTVVSIGGTLGAGLLLLGFVVVAAAARQAMVLTLYLVGAGLSGSAVRQVGVRPFVLGCLLWLGVSGVVLGTLRPDR